MDAFPPERSGLRREERLERLNGVGDSRKDGNRMEQALGSMEDGEGLSSRTSVVQSSSTLQWSSVVMLEVYIGLLYTRNLEMEF